MVIRIGHLTTPYHTAFILIGTKWIEKRMKVKVKWKRFLTGPSMISAFSKNELEIGYIGLTPAIIGIDNGLKIKCIAGGHIEGTVLVGKENFRTLKEIGNIKETLAQFKGKIIGVPARGSIHDVIIRQMIEKYKLQKEIFVRNFTCADLILFAMEENIIQGGCGTPSLGVACLKFINGKIVLPPNMMCPNNPSYGIIVKEEMIKNSYNILEKFLNLHEKASNLIRKKPYKASEITANVIGVLNKEFLLQVYSISPKYCASLPKEYIASTLAFVPILKKIGYISKSLCKEDIFYTEIIEKTHKEKPHY